MLAPIFNRKEVESEKVSIVGSGLGGAVGGGQR